MKKTLIIVLCVVLAVALMGCSAQEKTLEDLIPADQLSAFQDALNAQGDGSYTMEFTVEGNTLVCNYYYGEDTGIVMNDTLEEYFNSDAVSAALETMGQQAVAQFSANDDFADSGISSITFSVTYYDCEGTEMFSKDFDISVE